MAIATQDPASFNELGGAFHPWIFVNYPEPRQSMVKRLFEQKSREYLIDALQNWSNADVRTVPQVMFQLRCKSKEADTDVEFRFHLFMNCEETFVHNHQYEYYSYCLQGRYEEKLWEIDQTHKDSTTYRFARTAGNDISSAERIQGALAVRNRRPHFPGNLLHVEPHQYHSIASTSDSSNFVITFVARIVSRTNTRTTYIYSDEERITAPIDEIRVATADEREFIHRRLQSILPHLLCHDNL